MVANLLYRYFVVHFYQLTGPYNFETEAFFVNSYKGTFGPLFGRMSDLSERSEKGRPLVVWLGRTLKVTCTLKGHMEFIFELLL